MTEAEDAVRAAMAIARDIAEGRMDPAELAAVFAAEGREAFGRVAGPGDELWPLHVEVARQVLALGGVPVDELAEWVAVFRAAAGEPAVEAQPSWIEQALAAAADEERDERECANCGDEVLILSSRDWCDGCEAEADEA